MNEDWRGYLTPGERYVVAILDADVIAEELLRTYALDGFQTVAALRKLLRVIRLNLRCSWKAEMPWGRETCDAEMEKPKEDWCGPCFCLAQLLTEDDAR